MGEGAQSIVRFGEVIYPRSSRHVHSFIWLGQSRTTADKTEDEIVRPGFSSARYILWGNIYIFWHTLDLDVLYSTNGWGGNKHKCYRHIFVTDGPGEEDGAGINKNIFSKRYRHIFVTDLSKVPTDLLVFRLLRIFAESPVVTINNTERLSVVNQYGAKGFLNMFLGIFSFVFN